jgi:hypothetical protein
MRTWDLIYDAPSARKRATKGRAGDGPALDVFEPPTRSSP